MGSTEFLTAVAQSSRASITSFKSFPTIPDSVSNYSNSGSSTDYHTASEPAKSPRWVSPEIAYITADSFPIELGDIPSDASTPAASMAFVVGTLNKAESRTHEIDI
jgi:hypothetical protein